MFVLVLFPSKCFDKFTKNKHYRFFLVLRVAVIGPCRGLNVVLIPYDGVVTSHRRS